MTTIQNQNFGIEIELTGISRADAANIIAAYFGTESFYLGTYYDTYGAKDTKGRTWKCMSDSSIRVESKSDRFYAPRSFQCEVVSPILQYEDINNLQEIVRKLRAAGAIANDSCGIHVHVDGANHTPDSLVRLMNMTVGRQDIIYEALQIGNRANRWCKKISRDLLAAMKSDTTRSKASIERIWYSDANDHYEGGIDHQHYNSTRYHGVNLHAFFTKGTVEFRLFNGTTHAGKIKAYIQFCLAMSAWAINAKDSYSFRSMDGRDKATAFHDFLTRRLKLKGKEFATCRLHLMAAFETPADAEIA